MSNPPINFIVQVVQLNAMRINVSVQEANFAEFAAFVKELISCRTIFFNHDKLWVDVLDKFHMY
jgi:hypothetical protein